MSSIISGYTWEGDRGVVLFFTPAGTITASAPWSEWERFEKRVQEEPLSILMSDKTVQVPGNVFVPIHLADFGEFLRVIPEVLDAMRQERARGPISYFSLVTSIAEREGPVSIQGMVPWDTPSMPLVWSSQRGHDIGFF